MLGAILGSVLWMGSATPVQAWYEGRIVDADTKEPIAGVVVFMEWLKSQFPGEGRYYVDAFETLTDEQGRFSLPRHWTWNLWTMAMLSHEIIIFKSGYEPFEAGRWWELTAKEKGKPKDPDVWKIERGLPVIMLKKVVLETGEDYRKQRERMGFVGPGGGPAEKSVLLRREIEREYDLILPK